jgi:hypothetical protein
MYRPDPIAVTLNPSIHNLLLDATRPRFYSLPIFDTRLALPAIPVAVRERRCRAVYHSPLLFPLNPTISQSIQHFTQLPLTEVSTLLD